MSPNPIFPAGGDELKALAPVLELVCCESKDIYDKEKTQRRDIAIADMVGAPYRRCAATTYSQMLTGECYEIMQELVKCNKRYEYTYSYDCKSIRDSLLKCAIKSKMGEIGQKF